MASLKYYFLNIHRFCFNKLVPRVFFFFFIYVFQRMIIMEKANPLSSAIFVIFQHYV